MNLVLNARDAMPDGGKLAIMTTNVDVDENGIAGCPDAVPGKYALITVTDTGVGMDEQTVQSVFELFYTTKERGKGTGLGLSTVCCIVRQSGGWIQIRSEVGHGIPSTSIFPKQMPSRPRSGRWQPRQKSGRMARRCWSLKTRRMFAGRSEPFWKPWLPRPGSEKRPRSFVHAGVDLERPGAAATI